METAALTSVTYGRRRFKLHLMSLRVAVIGAGYMGQLHARVVAESPLAQLAAIVDVNRESGEAIATGYGIPWFSTVDSICEDGTIDAAIVAVPDTAHEEPACRLLQAGKAVLLEKPMAHTLDAARRIGEVARSSQGRLMVGHLLRFDPRYAGAAACIAEGVIGRPLHITARRFTLRQVGRRLAGRSSPCFYLGVHDIDAMQWVSGRKVRRVFARAVSSAPRESTQPPTEDAIFATCELEDGMAGNLQFGWTLPDNSPSGINARLEVVGTLGCVDVDTHDHGLSVLGPSGLTLPDGLHWPEVNSRITGNLAEEVNHFVRGLCYDQAFLVTVDDAMRNVAVNDAIMRSLQSNALEVVETVGS
jgi:myo-inositol 2-dehydrogenase/D-chiro-inositol 1-dehydrogenase